MSVNAYNAINSDLNGSDFRLAFGNISVTDNVTINELLEKVSELFLQQK